MKSLAFLLLASNSTVVPKALVCKLLIGTLKYLATLFNLYNWLKCLKMHLSVLDSWRGESLSFIPNILAPSLLLESPGRFGNHWNDIVDVIGVGGLQWRELPWRTHCSGRWEAAPPEKALFPDLEAHYNFPRIKQDILGECHCIKVKTFEAVHF